MTSKLLLYIFITANLLLSLTINTNCTGKNILTNKDKTAANVKIAYPEHVQSMIKQLTLYNKNSPDSISLHFVIIGSTNNKKFKSIGSLRYNKNLSMLDTSFFDYIFKSPIIYIFQNKSSLNFYFPADKRIVIDNINTINLQNYLDLNIKFNILYKLFSGKIPIISNYSVKKGFKAKNSSDSYLILENDNFFETISFHKNIPNKILFINKISKEKFEIYLSKIMKNNKSYYFRKIKVISRKNKLKFEFFFNNIRLNKAVKVKTIKSIRVPRNVKIISM